MHHTKGGKIFLVNVGANRSHPFSSPIFQDGSFEFIPIPEAKPGPHSVRYCDLRSYRDPKNDLLSFVPPRYHKVPCHNDPEFVTFTYGDLCQSKPGAFGLKKAEPHDFLFFLARLVPWRDGRFVQQRAGFYLIGFLEIEHVVKGLFRRPRGKFLARVRRNAHVIRGMNDNCWFDGFWLFLGSSRSVRFSKAVPFTRKLASRVMLTSRGLPLIWGPPRTSLQVIGSYTRSRRCIIDPGVPKQEARAALLWSHVKQHAGVRPVESYD